MHDDLDIPPFLRRENTPEQQRRVARIVAHDRAPKIKNPPKRVKRSTRLLGLAIGTRVKRT